MYESVDTRGHPLKLEVQTRPLLNHFFIGSDVCRGAVGSGHQLEDAHPGQANKSRR
jgi:hypothetical protein